MLSVRLNAEVEAQLEFVATTSGLSKNQIVGAALEQYLKMQDLGSIPLEQSIQEVQLAGFLHRQKLQNEEAKNAVLVANWAKSCGIWSAKPNPSGKPNGALHGRNVVLGFAWNDEKVDVISKWMPPNPTVGADAYAYNILSYERWIAVMRLCETK